MRGRYNYFQSNRTQIKKRWLFNRCVATDGNQASEKVSANEYDLIMTDLLMPFCSGLELVNKVRNDLKLSTPIIVLSRIGNEETIIEAFQLGADDYISKPFSPNELTIRVKRLLIKR